jgi:hypothetical protein
VGAGARRLHHGWGIQGLRIHLDRAVRTAELVAHLDINAVMLALSLVGERVPSPA